MYLIHVKKSGKARKGMCGSEIDIVGRLLALYAANLGSNFILLMVPQALPGQNRAESGVILNTAKCAHPPKKAATKKMKTKLWNGNESRSLSRL